MSPHLWHYERDAAGDLCPDIQKSTDRAVVCFSVSVKGADEYNFCKKFWRVVLSLQSDQATVAMTDNDTVRQFVLFAQQADIGCKGGDRELLTGKSF